MLVEILTSAFFVKHAARFRLRKSRPTDAPTVFREGRDPIRVLITGAGLAAGYGVKEHERSIAGPLANHLRSRAGRGVRLGIRAAPMLRASDAVSHIGRNGTHTDDAVIFAPCFLESTFTNGPGMARHAHHVQEHLRRTGIAQLRVVMLGIPEPRQISKLDLVAAHAASATSRAFGTRPTRTRRSSTSSRLRSTASGSIIPSPLRTTQT